MCLKAKKEKREEQLVCFCMNSVLKALLWERSRDAVRKLCTFTKTEQKLTILPPHRGNPHTHKQPRGDHQHHKHIFYVVSIIFQAVCWKKKLKLLQNPFIPAVVFLWFANNLSRGKDRKQTDSRLNISSRDKFFLTLTKTDSLACNLTCCGFSVCFPAQIQSLTSFFPKFSSAVTQLNLYTAIITLSVGINSDLNCRERGFCLPFHSSTGAQSIFTDRRKKKKARRRLTSKKRRGFDGCDSSLGLLSVNLTLPLSSQLSGSADNATC